MSKNQKIKNNLGLSLINVLVGIGLIIIAFLGIWNMFNFTLKIIAQNRFRTQANALANEKIELIRNLPYDAIGTIGGIPAGATPQTESVIRGGSAFTVTTNIFYIDDPYDNLVPQDLLGADYKKIKITVDWSGRIYGEPALAYTHVSPKGVETDNEGGTIRLIVFNALGLAIPSANVQIINNTLTPPINLSSITDQSGILLVPGAPATPDRSYEIIVTKDGYTEEKTYPEGEGLEPTIPHIQVLEDQISEKSFTIDLLSTLNITTIGKDSPTNWKVNTASTSAEQLSPDLAIDSNNYYYFVWQDNKDTSSFRIYAQKYDSNKNALWTEDKRISTANNQINPRLKTNGTALYITWNDDREGNQDSYLIKLDTNGNGLWSGDKKISSLNQNKDQTFPSLALEEATLNSFLAFQENSGPDDNYDIYAHSYDANGSPNWTNALKVNDDATAKNQNYPQIAFFNDTQNSDKVIYIVWQDERNNNQDIYAYKYNATGTALWANNLKINTDSGSTNQTEPEIALDSNGNLYIVWQDDRNGNPDIYLHKYDSTGTALWANEIKVHENSSANQTSPAIAINSNNEIFISWTDERYFDTHGKEIFAQKFDSNSNRLWSQDEAIIQNDNTDSHQDQSRLTLDNLNYIVFTWQDERDEDTDIDIFAARYQGPGIITTLPNIPLNIKGTKQIYNNPQILKHDNNYTTNQNGNLLLNDVEWDSYIIEPQSTSTYTLISSNPPQPIIINPNESINVELNIE